MTVQSAVMCCVHLIQLYTLAHRVAWNKVNMVEATGYRLQLSILKFNLQESAFFILVAFGRKEQGAGIDRQHSITFLYTKIEKRRRRGESV